jgi:catechol 2,3-dioxygenase-like lactoylglutathione lyase family enzyme
MDTPILRIARPTDNLEALLRFYRDGLGLVILYRFEDHDGFDGIMLGQKGWPYHLEFTRKRGQATPRAPTKENLLVFYLPSAALYRRNCIRCIRRSYRLRAFPGRKATLA